MQDKYIWQAELPLEDYTDFAREHKYCNILQSPAWPQVKSQWQAERLGLRNSHGELLAAGQVLKRPLKFGQSFWYLPHGPLLDYENKELFTAFLNGLKEHAKQSSAIFVRIHPPCPVRSGSLADFRAGQAQENFPASDFIETCAQAGYRYREPSLAMSDTIQPRFQAVVLKSAWQEPPRGKIRYNLKLNERYFVELGEGPDKLEAFDELIRLTEARQNIQLRDKAYFARMLQAYGEDALLAVSRLDLASAQAHSHENLEKLQAELAACGDSSPKKQKQLEEQIISRQKDSDFFDELNTSLGTESASDSCYTAAGILAIRFGKAAEMPYAGSDERFSRIPSMWSLYTKGIRWAFEHGSERYNLGGLEGSLDDGLSIFKSHFDPLIEESLGEFDLVLKPRIYRWAMRSWQFYKKLRTIR